jgi:hypothetical protein
VGRGRAYPVRARDRLVDLRQKQKRGTAAHQRPCPAGDDRFVRIASSFENNVRSGAPGSANRPWSLAWCSFFGQAMGCVSIWPRRSCRRPGLDGERVAAQAKGHRLRRWRDPGADANSSAGALDQRCRRRPGCRSHPRTNAPPDHGLRPPIAPTKRHTRESRRWRQLIGIDCSNEDRGPAVCFCIDRMRWRPPESADKVRRGLGGFIKSVCNTQARGGGDGNGPEQPLLRKLNAERTAGAPVTTGATVTGITTIQAIGEAGAASAAARLAKRRRNSPEIKLRPILVGTKSSRNGHRLPMTA